MGLISELSFNNEQRINFPITSVDGLKLFRSAANALMNFGNLLKSNVDVCRQHKTPVTCPGYRGRRYVQIPSRLHEVPQQVLVWRLCQLRRNGAVQRYALNLFEPKRHRYYSRKSLIPSLELYVRSGLNTIESTLLFCAVLNSLEIS